MSVKKIMRTEEGRLFGRALLEAVTGRIEDTLSQYNETLRITDEHSRCVKKTLRSYKLRRRRKIIAAIVAATLLLGGCTFGYEIFKEEIGSFIETIHPDEIVVSYNGNSEDPKTVKNVYELTYVPEGYELSRSEISRWGILLIWNGQHGESISFLVDTLQNLAYHLDNEGTESNLFYYNDIEIYRRKANDSHYVNLWVMDSYMMHLSSSYELSEEELVRIIDGIRITMSMEEYEKIQASIIKPGRR